MALNPNMITKCFNHVLKPAGVPHFRFHDCRHYCASTLHAIDVPDAYIMEGGGWGHDGTLKNVYRHAMEDQKSKMVNKANERFNAMARKYKNTRKYGLLVNHTTPCINIQYSEVILCLHGWRCLLTSLKNSSFFYQP